MLARIPLKMRRHAVGEPLVKWMIYGANGYTGELIAREAKRRGLTPVIAGRNAASVGALGTELQLETRSFGLDDSAAIARGLDGITLVLHCAGPFSATSRPMIEACLSAHVHYLDITGEISVFEHAQAQNERARQAGCVICPGVGFDVIPTDCVAAALKDALPDATHLSLGFDSRSGFSPGTAKTSVEALAQGGKVRRDGRIVAVPLAYSVRKIDFGNGPKLAMTIPWGDVSTAWYTTGIPNIEVFLPGSPSMIANAKRANYFRWLLGWPPVQRAIKKRIAKTVKGPDEKLRDKHVTYVWGEARNAAGVLRTARVQTANGYSLTVTGSLAAVEQLLREQPTGGAYTPSRLFGSGLVTKLPGSGEISIT
jgi:short subunit dehydrogenase-like uncharacterized protein